MTLFFGLIHGMDFFELLPRFALFDASILVPLVAFNVGIELGQIIIVAVIVGAAFVYLNLSARDTVTERVHLRSAAASWRFRLMVKRFW